MYGWPPCVVSAMTHQQQLIYLSDVGTTKKKFASKAEYVEWLRSQK